MIYYICNRPDKEKSLENHCLSGCYHGKPHIVDGCSKNEICNIDCGLVNEGNKECKKSIFVRCRPATKAELEKYGLV
jgi:hypothetical protein